MTRLIRARWLQIAGAALGVALFAAFLIGVSPYPTEVLGQTTEPETRVTYRCEGGTLVIRVAVGAQPGLPAGFVRETRVPVGFLCPLILSFLQGNSPFGRDIAPGAPYAGPATA